MTNEELAEQAAGSSRSYAALMLWERVRPLLDTMCRRTYSRRKSWFDRCGVTLQDLRQTAYLDVFIPALKAYTPEKELKFTSYLSYPLMNAVNHLLGMHNGSENRKPLDNCISLDSEITPSDGAPVTMVEIVPDENLVSHDVQITQTEKRRTVRAAVLRLDEPFRKLLDLYYYHSMSVSQIANANGKSEKDVRQLINKGIRQLRKDADIKLLMNYAQLCCVRFGTVYGFDRNEFYPGYEDSEEYTRACEKAADTSLSYGQRQAVHYEAYYNFWRKHHDRKRR